MAGPRLELIVGGEAGAKTPFDALLAAAEEDPEAAEALALGYAELSREERAAIVDAVVRDAEAGGRSPSTALALLLAVEEDRHVARDIAAALVDAGFGAAPEPAKGAIARDLGWAWGGRDEGGIAIVRHLHGLFIEVACVGWRGGELEPPRVEPIARGEHLDEVRRRIGVPESADRLAFDDAIDRLAAQLWRIRRARGALPERLRALAHLFAVPYQSPL
ncbi:MAG TPA: hypothetical protein VIL20_07310 [Sandaracinaceae bacterium]